MKNQLLPIIICLLIGMQLAAQTASFPPPFEVKEPDELGVFGQYLFFSNEWPDNNTEQLWQFDTQSKEFLKRSADSTFLVDFQLTPNGVFWLEKDLNNRFGIGQISLWFWAGEAEQAPERLQSATAANARLLDHSDNHLFLHFDLLVLSVDLNTIEIQNIGLAPTPDQGNQGVIWQGRYYWSVTGSTQKSQIYWADPSEGLQLFWQAERRVYNFIPLGDRLLWREGPRLVRYDWESAGPEYYYEFKDWDEQISFFGEWFGASLNDSLYLFPAATVSTGSEPWRTDGTTEGTYLLKDIATERTGNFTPGSFPFYMHQNDRKIHFLAYTKLTEGQQHWESDGTAEGTLLKSELLGPDDRVYFGYPINDSVYVLYINSDLGGLEPALFSNDLSFFDLHAGPASSIGSIFPHSSIGLKDGSVIMEAFTAESGREPWILSPDQGEAQLADIAPRRAWSRGPILGEVDGMIYLIGGNVDQGYQLYQIDPRQEVDLPTADAPVRWQQSISPSVVPGASVFWVYSIGLARASDGSLYSSGSTNLNTSDLKFSRGVQPLPTEDLFADAYVTRMDREGLTEWIMPLPGSFVWSDVPMISETIDGGVYAGGRYSRSAQLGQTPVLAGTGDAYLAKINANGEEEWVKTITLGGGEIFRLRTDSLGYVWAIGSYRNQAFIDGVALSSRISPAYFVARWSPDGQLEWATTLEASLDWPSFGPVHAANIDPSGNLWLFLNNMGHNFNAPCNFGTIYGRLVKLGPTGTILTEQEWSGDDAWYATDLSFTAQGNVLLAGRFRGNLQLGDIPLEYSGFECSSTGFIAKIDPFGAPVRARATENGRIPEAVVANADGTYTLAGYQNLSEQTNYPGYSHFPFGRKQQRIFTSIYSSTDSLLADRNFLANEDFDQGGFIFLLPDSDDGWVLQGEVDDMLDTIGSVQPSFGVGHYIYLMSFDLPYTLPQEEADENLLKEEILAFPNPTTDYVIIQSEDMDFDQADIALYNAQGQRLSQMLERFEPSVYRMNLSGLPVGIYQLVVQLGDQVLSKPIYKVE